jgi:hypothetical protein
MDMTQRLFIGIFPAGIVYADRQRERSGDYLRLAFLSYSSLELEIRPRCPSELADLIRAHAASLQSRRGEQYEISSCGQTITLGYGLGPPMPATESSRTATDMTATTGGDPTQSIPET